MKKKIFLLILTIVSMFAVSMISSNKVQAEGERVFTVESGATAEGNVFTITASDGKAYVRTDASDVDVTANVYVSLKFTNESVKNLDIYVVGKNSAGADVHEVVSYKVATEAWNKVEFTEYNGFTIATAYIHTYFAADSLDIVELNAIEFILRGSKGGICEILDYAITTDGNHGFDTTEEGAPEQPGEPEQPENPVVPEVVKYDFAATSGAVLENGVYTMNSTRATLTAAANYAVSSTAHISLLFNATNIDNFDLKVVAEKEDGTSTELTIGASCPGAWNKTEFIEYGDFNLLTVQSGSYLDGYTKITSAIVYIRGYEGSTFEILDFTITDNGKHGFKLPMSYSDLYVTNEVFTLSKNEDNEPVVSYSSNPGWHEVKLDVSNYDVNKTIFEAEFTPSANMQVCFVINDEYESHFDYEAGQRATYTVDLVELGVVFGDSLEVVIFLDANAAAGSITEEKSVTFHSIKVKAGNLADLEFNVNDLEVDYTGEAVLLDVECAEDVEFVYEYALAGSTEWLAGLPVNAGEYVVRVSYKGEEYNEASVEANVVINKIASSINEDDVVVDLVNRVITVKEGIEVSIDPNFDTGYELYDGDEVYYGQVVYYRNPGDANHLPSEVLQIAVERPHVHAPSGEWQSDENEHWQVCDCDEAVEFDRASHEYVEEGFGKGYVFSQCVCGAIDEESKVAHATYEHTYNPGDGSTTTDYLKATLNVDGSYTFELTTPKWGRFVLYYNGVAVSSADVTMLEGTAWNGGAYTGGYHFYHDGDATVFLSATGGDYKVKYNPEENTLLLGEEILPLPEGAHVVQNLNADAELAVWNTAGFEIKDITGAYKTPNGWRLFIVVDAQGRIAYMGQNMVNGYGGAMSTTYIRHSAYADYKTNPAFTALSDEYQGQWGMTVDWALGVPEGGFIITAHGASKTALVELVTGLVGEAQTDGAVNSNAIDVDNIRIIFNDSQKYVQVVHHEHVAGLEWLKDDTNHWHECECGEVMDKAAHVWGEGEVTTAPTEDAEGVRTFTCECGQTKTESIEKLPHTHKPSSEWLKDETHHWHSCTCAELVDKAAHVWGEGEVTTAPTEDAEGVRTFTCECGQTKTESIEKLPAPLPPVSEPEDEDDGGCRGSIIGTTFAVIGLFGAVLVLRKKREE